MDVNVVTRTVRLPGWPSAGKFKIILLADFHVAWPWMQTRRLEQVLAQAQMLGGDMICLLGDFPGHLPFSKRTAPDVIASTCGGLSADYGVWAVLGNHDWRDDPQAQQRGMGPTHWHTALEKHNVPVLENRAVHIQGDKVDFFLAGLGSQWAFRRNRKIGVDGVHDVALALWQVPETANVVLLAHEPDIFDDLPDQIGLTLSGHTHGGQIKPFGYPIVVPSRFGARYAYGHITKGERQLIVSGGLGCSGLPLRLGTRPEITVVEVSQ